MLQKGFCFFTLNNVFLTFFVPFLSSLLPSTGLLFWDYYVTMPMPASTFTLAVGHWRQATAEFTTAIESWPSGRMECGETAKAGPGSETVAGPAAEAGSSTSEVIKCSTLQTGRYFIIFPVFASSVLLVRLPPLQCVLNPRLAL